MLLASYRHSPAAAAVVKFFDVTEISEQEAHVVCACAAILCLSAMPQQRRSRRLLNECACVVPGLHRDGWIEAAAAVVAAAATSSRWIILDSFFSDPLKRLLNEWQLLQIVCSNGPMMRNTAVDSKSRKDHTTKKIG
ncbi:hypothetical protein ACLKA7_007995 [Drosophila subpalustris]